MKFDTIQMAYQEARTFHYSFRSCASPTKLWEDLLVSEVDVLSYMTYACNPRLTYPKSHEAEAERILGGKEELLLFLQLYLSFTKTQQVLSAYGWHMEKCQNERCSQQWPER